MLMVSESLLLAWCFCCSKAIDNGRSQTVSNNQGLVSLCCPSRRTNDCTRSGKRMGAVRQRGGQLLEYRGGHSQHGTRPASTKDTEGDKVEQAACSVSCVFIGRHGHTLSPRASASCVYTVVSLFHVPLERTTPVRCP
jgi:hypothetical protein